MSDWGVGMGLMYVYVDNLDSPIITTPINLDKTLKLDRGRAYVGFTASTGNTHWQTHDILQWSFESLYLDETTTKPLVVNGEGGFQCVDDKACVNRPDEDHFNRKNNIPP